MTSHSLRGLESVGEVGPVHDDALDRLVHFQERTQCRILQGLQLNRALRACRRSARRDVREKQVDFLIGNDVADVLRLIQ